MTPFDDFSYLINHVLLGEEPVSECIRLNLKFASTFVQGNEKGRN